MKTDSSNPSEFHPRILVINSASRLIGEAEHTVNLVQGLHSRGVFVVLACRRNHALEDIVKKTDIPYCALRMKSKFTGIDNLIDLLTIRRLIKKFRINTVHCHRGKDHWLSVSALRLIRKTERPCLIRTRHVTVPVKNHVFNRWLYKRGTDRFIAVSQAAASSLQGLPLPQPPAIIYAAIDTNRFSPDKRSNEAHERYGIPVSEPDAPLIGLVGRIQGVKGQRVFIQSVNHILHFIPNARFVIAGRGSPERLEPLCDIAKKQGVIDRIHFAGYVENIEELIASLDVGVIASLGSEGSSRICMEYMASNVPVVSSGVGGVPELLDDGLLGLLVEPGRPELLARAVIETILDENAVSNRVQAARKKALEFLNIDRFLDETIGIYENCHNCRKTPYRGVS